MIRFEPDDALVPLPDETDELVDCALVEIAGPLTDFILFFIIL